MDKTNICYEICEYRNNIILFYMYVCIRSPSIDVVSFALFVISQTILNKVTKITNLGLAKSF